MADTPEFNHLMDIVREAAKSQLEKQDAASSLSKFLAGTPTPSSSSSSSSSSLLSSLLIKKPLSFTKTNLYFRGKRIDIDGYVFYGCRFDNCKLHTSKGTFKFKDCVFDGSTQVIFEGAARKILQLYKSTGTGEKVSAMLNTDGTITIE
ncbi:MAG: hypothetical protein V1739_00550 [Candidatus Omnitrophota bacterium]